MLERPIDGPAGGEPDGELGTADAIGTDERRMHVRAYNHWVSLLDGRAYPTVADLTGERSQAFAPHSVLLDFRGGQDNPAIGHIGDLLRDECGVDETIRSVSDVPSRSLLSRLTDHYLQIIANQAPVGFEAEFFGTRGTTMMYRGILMPFSSDGSTIDFIYGVINWKELLDEVSTTELRLEMEQALVREDRAPTCWEDGPSHMEEPPLPSPAGQEKECGLADRLALAREEAERARSTDERGRLALYRAIGRAYDVALAAEADPEAYTELLDDNGLAVQARAPMTPIAKLVFGSDHDKTRLAEIATALTAAKAEGLETGTVADWLGGQEGGLKGLVTRVRASRCKRPRQDRASDVRERLRKVEPTYVLEMPGREEFVLIVARRVDGGHVGLLDLITDEKAVERALATLNR